MLHTVLSKRILFIVFLLLVASVGFSQVSIKEKIPITPNALPQAQASMPVHTLQFEAVWDVPIFARMYTHGCNGRFDTATSAMRYEIPLTSGQYQFDFQLRVAQLFAHQVCTVTMTVKVDGNTVLSANSSYVGGGMEVFALWPGGPPTYSSPYNTTFAFSIGDSIFYEEGRIPDIQGVNTCDPGTWDPSSTVNLQIIGGAGFAQFYDYNTRLPQGASISGTVRQIQENYVFVADGMIPDSSGVIVTVQASSGGITQTASVKVKPYYLLVSVDEPRINYGEETPIRVQSLDVQGNVYYRTVMPMVRVRIVDSLTYGTLWYGTDDSSYVRQMGDTLTEITSLVNAGPYSGLEARFYANERRPMSSVGVTIAVEKTGEGAMIDYVPPNAQPFQGRDTVRGTTRVTVTRPVSNFAGFMIKLSRDTLEYRQTADVTVIAIDVDSQEVAIDTGTVMTLLFDDGGPFVDFIPFPGDTVETTVASISYGTLRSGTVKIVAAKKFVKPPPVIAAFSQRKIPLRTSSSTRTMEEGGGRSYPKSQIIATQVSDVTKVGKKDAFFKPAIRVIAVQDSIKPFYPSSDGRTYVIDTTESRTKVKVVVTVSGRLYTLPIPYVVKLTSAAVDSSGGHSHTANRPTGYFGDSIRDTVKTKEFETGTDTLRTSYLASMFGGKERIIATLTDFAAIADTDTVVVRVPGLVLMRDSTEIYYKTGGTNSHHGPRIDSQYPNARTPDDNHYLSSKEAIDSLVSAAIQFTKARWNTSGKMRLNDMSLKYGGLFDVDSNWTVPHKAHRIGKSVDIENLDLIQIDTVDQKTGGRIKLTVPKVKWVKDFVDFMQNDIGNWRFEDEDQTLSDIYKRTRKYPHFEWRGK